MKELIREELVMVSGGGDSDDKSLYGDFGYALGYFIGLVASVNKAVEDSVFLHFLVNFIVLMQWRIFGIG